MKDIKEKIALKEKIKINGNEYRYNADYDRLDLIDADDEEKIIPNHVPIVACPKCLATKFQIRYGSYQCIAQCDCGHSMNVYEG